MKIKIYVVEMFDRENNLTVKKGFLQEADAIIAQNMGKIDGKSYYFIRRYTVEKIIEL